MHSVPDGCHPQLPNLHGASWLAGGAMLVVLLSVGSPEVLSRDYQPGFIDLTDFLIVVEPFALIASTVYAVEHLIRRCRRGWHFSLKDALIAILTACLMSAVVAQQYGLAQYIKEEAQLYPLISFVYPPLVGSPWVPWLLLWFGITCLAYTVARGAVWGLGMVVWWMTLNWERPGDHNGNEDIG